MFEQGIQLLRFTNHALDHPDCLRVSYLLVSPHASLFRATYSFRVALSDRIFALFRAKHLSIMRHNCDNSFSRDSKRVFLTNSYLRSDDLRAF